MGEEENLVDLGNGLVFNLESTDSATFNELRGLYQGTEFGMAAIPELIDFFCAFKEKRIGDEFEKILRTYGITANTAVYYFPKKGMFFEDKPRMKGGQILRLSFRELESKLEQMKDGVAFSGDGRTRFVQDYETGFQKGPEISRGIVALAGGEERAKKLAFPYFFFGVDLQDVKSPLTRVVFLDYFEPVFSVSTMHNPNTPGSS